MADHPRSITILTSQIYIFSKPLSPAAKTSCV
jgi:hypothetical protein